MIIFLALVLIILMILIGGERGAVSLMTLAGNIVILFISILLMSIVLSIFKKMMPFSVFIMNKNLSTQNHCNFLSYKCMSAFVNLSGNKSISTLLQLLLQMKG